MLVALGVDYGSAAVTTLCVGFATWRAAEADLGLVVHTETAPEPYAPGELYRRELLHLLNALDRVDAWRSTTSGRAWRCTTSPCSRQADGSRARRPPAPAFGRSATEPGGIEAGGARLRPWPSPTTML